MLGGGFVLVLRRHVNVNLLYERLSRRTQAIVDLCTSPFFFAFVGVLTWQAMRFFYRSFSIREHSITVFGPPMYPVKFMLVLVALLLLLQGVAKFIQDFQIALGKEEE
jgi:TRAP-type mannitol/chloroaromatic compound transport system permease small subunit